MEALCRDASSLASSFSSLTRTGWSSVASERVVRREATSVALLPGVTWDEKGDGTNAIGAVLAERQAISVIGGEHFFQIHSILSCSAAPIFDPFGAIAACWT